MPRSLPFNELEYLILAMVREGAPSGYAIRKRMAKMRIGRWSSESGSVYRVLRRLESDGMVRVVGRTTRPQRARTEYEITEDGDGAVLQWLTQPPGFSELAMLGEPLRARAYFLFGLDPDIRIGVVEAWTTASRDFLRQTEAAIEVDGLEWPDRLCEENLLELATARHRWLVAALKKVRQEASSA